MSPHYTLYGNNWSLFPLAFFPLKCGVVSADTFCRKEFFAAARLEVRATWGEHRGDVVATLQNVEGTSLQNVDGTLKKKQHV